ncbi:hypothetical protein [Nocardia pseudovaccinii]|nr:hypothetical protein [Nocardia pseudovaccinii]
MQAQVDSGGGTCGGGHRSVDDTTTRETFGLTASKLDDVFAEVVSAS